MKRWALISNNIVTLVVEQNDKPFVYTENNKFWIECIQIVGPGWLYENGQFIDPNPPPPPLPNIITKVALRFRLTDAEYAGIITAARTDVEVAAWVETFNMVATIDLDNQRTKDGVANLVSKNLLTQVRSEEILTAPVQPAERP